MIDPDLPTFDRDVLLELRESMGGDDEFVAELIETYLADGPVQLDAIDAAIASGDAAALVLPAHTLKSSSASLGARRLAEICRGLEQDGRAGRLGEGTEAAVAARTEWAGVAAELSGWAAEAGVR